LAVRTGPLFECRRPILPTVAVLRWLILHRKGPGGGADSEPAAADAVRSVLKRRRLAVVTAVVVYGPKAAGKSQVAEVPGVAVS
jgi:hypothetical protein